MPTPLLDHLLASEPRKLTWFEVSRETEFVGRHAEQLLEAAAALPAIENIEKLAANGDSFEKFQSLLSELRVAILFARLGGTAVELLRDEQFGRRFYTPDLRVAFGSGWSFLVEVTWGSSGLPSFTEPLTSALRAAGLRFMVWSYPGLTLSCPGIGWQERREQDREVERVVAQLVEHLGRVPEGSTGECTIGAHRFRYEPSPTEEGFAAGASTTAHWVPIDAQAERFLHKVRAKAERRSKLPPAERATPFVVVCENDEHELEPEAVFFSLLGKRFGTSPVDRWMITESQRRWPPAVEDARSRGWDPLLRRGDFGPDARCGYEPEFGPYLQSGGWASDLSAVIVLHCTGRVQWLPNPWAEVADLRFLDLGLPLDDLGAPHPARVR